MGKQRSAPKQSHTLEPPIGFNLRLLGTALALSMVTGAYILCRLPVGIPGEWLTPYRTHFPSPGAAAFFGAAMAVFVAAAALFDHFVAEQGRAARALAVAFSTILAVVVLFASASCGPQGSAELVAPSCMYDGPGLFQREAARIVDAEDSRAEFIVPGADAVGQEQVLQVTGALDYLARFPLILKHYAEDYRKTVRVNNNPPGTTMVFYAAFRLAEVAPGLSRVAAGPVFGLGFQPPSTMSAGTLLGSWTLLLGAALAFVPAYLVASRIMDKPAFLVAAVGSLAGSALLFVPGKDTLQIFFFLWMFYFFLRRHSGRALVWGVLLGLMAALGFFFTLAPAVVVAVLVVCSAWLAISEGKSARKDELVFWLAAIVGLLAGIAALYITVHYNTFASVLACYVNHKAFYVHYPRTYWKWMLYNPLEFVMFLGGPLAVMVAWYALRKPSRQEGDPRIHANRIYLLSALVVLAVLDLSGKNSSEINRLWVFLMPLLALPACALARRDKSGVNNLLAAAAIQIAMVLVLKTYLDVWHVENLFREMGIFP